jgi:hypothetical protein
MPRLYPRGGQWPTSLGAGWPSLGALRCTRSPHRRRPPHHAQGADPATSAAADPWDVALGQATDGLACADDASAGRNVGRRAGMESRLSARTARSPFVRAPNRITSNAYGRGLTPKGGAGSEGENASRSSGTPAVREKAFPLLDFCEKVTSISVSGTEFRYPQCAHNPGRYR